MPPIRPVEDQIGNEHARNRPVRHAHTRVAGHDVDVVLPAGVPADERQAVERFHDLPGPAELHSGDHRKTLARPSLETTVPLLRIIGLPGLVVFATQDQHIVRRLAVHVLQPHIVVRIIHVPKQRVRDRLRWDSRADHVRGVRSLLRDYEYAIIDRSVRGHDDGAGGYHVRTGRHPRHLAAFDPIDVRPGKYPAAFFLDRARQARDIFERMESRLIGIADTGAGIEEIEGRARQSLDRKTGASHARELILQGLNALARRQKQKAVEAFEVAVDFLGPNDAFDTVDRAAVAFGGKPRILRPAPALHDAIRVVHGRREMRARHTRDAARQHAILQHNDFSTSGGEVIRD